MVGCMYRSCVARYLSRHADPALFAAFAWFAVYAPAPAPLSMPMPLPPLPAPSYAVDWRRSYGSRPVGCKARPVKGCRARCASRCNVLCVVCYVVCGVCCGTPDAPAPLSSAAVSSFATPQRTLTLTNMPLRYDLPAILSVLHFCFDKRVNLHNVTSVHVDEVHSTAQLVFGTEEQRFAAEACFR